MEVSLRIWAACPVPTALFSLLRPSLKSRRPDSYLSVAREAGWESPLVVQRRNRTHTWGHWFPNVHFLQPCSAHLLHSHGHVGLTAYSSMLFTQLLQEPSWSKFKNGCGSSGSVIKKQAHLSPYLAFLRSNCLVPGHDLDKSADT